MKKKARYYIPISGETGFWIARVIDEKTHRYEFLSKDKQRFTENGLFRAKTFREAVQLLKSRFKCQQLPSRTKNYLGYYRYFIGFYDDCTV